MEKSNFSFLFRHIEYIIGYEYEYNMAEMSENKKKGKESTVEGGVGVKAYILRRRVGPL